MNYESWHDSHEPKKFERTAKSSRLSPIQDDVPHDPFWIIVIGCIAACIVFAVMIFEGL